MYHFKKKSKHEAIPIVYLDANLFESSSTYTN